ncbi:MAG: hypothetical protein GXY55_06000 [Phycisphaerae bacterium]|nr:hypothetical protein [Phycisphaerae bacterium]
MDLLNLGAIDLEMRILVGGNFGDWTSNSAFTVPADGQWHRAVFGLTANELVWGGDQGGNSANLEDALRYCGGFHIRHQAGEPLGWRGTTPIASSLGIDNVTAVPEPVFGMLVAGAMLFLRRHT